MLVIRLASAWANNMHITREDRSSHVRASEIFRSICPFIWSFPSIHGQSYIFGLSYQLCTFAGVPLSCIVFINHTPCRRQSPNLTHRVPFSTRLLGERWRNIDRRQIAVAMVNHPHLHPHQQMPLHRLGLHHAYERLHQRPKSLSRHPAGEGCHHI